VFFHFNRMQLYCFGTGLRGIPSRLSSCSETLEDILRDVQVSYS
jgi:hypothetical protein